MKPNYQIITSSLLESPSWEEFVEKAFDTHYSQSTFWANVKLNKRWKTLRIMIKHNDSIVAGAQIYIRPYKIKALGNVGYISKAPIFIEKQPSPELIDFFLLSLKTICKEKKIGFLALQPPNNGEYLIEPIKNMGGFEIPGENIIPPGTAIIDLSLETRVIYSKFKKQLRNDIRRSIKKGVSIREGSNNDIPLFYVLLQKTAERQGFKPDNLEYYQYIWQQFNPHGNITLFISEYNHEPISGIMLICFNDTVTFWRGGWSGEHSSLCPNEQTHWAVIQWAKEQGYRYYDLGGLVYSAALELVNLGKLSKDFKSSVTSFKTKFATDIVVFPSTYFYLYNPFLRTIAKWIFPLIKDNYFTQKIINNFH